jgi:hypothetical protein
MRGIAWSRMFCRLNCRLRRPFPPFPDAIESGGADKLKDLHGREELRWKRKIRFPRIDFALRP